MSAVRDEWEDRSLKTFINIYERQLQRTRAVIKKTDRDQIRQEITRLYLGEAPRVRLEAIKLFDDMATDVATRILDGSSIVVDWSDIIESILKLSAKYADVFSKTITDNSLRVVYSVVDDWIQTPGSTVGDLVRRMERIWRGPRPRTAAITETTRLYNETTAETYKRMGVWGFQPQTRNDDRVRSSHKEYADEGPYPMSRTDRLPPYDDYGCRCTITAVLEDPDGG